MINNHIVVVILLLILVTIIITERIECHQQQRFTILHTSDLHSHFEGIGPDAQLEETRGHFARLKYAITHLQKTLNPLSTLTLDAGDWNSGTFFHLLQVSYQYPELVPEFSFLQECNYDATILGNHEFDGSELELSSMIQKAKKNNIHLPILTSNIVLEESCELHKHYIEDCQPEYIPSSAYLKTNNLTLHNGCSVHSSGVVITPYILKELKSAPNQKTGVKVAIIGLFSINAEQLSAKWRTCSKYHGTLNRANFGELIQSIKSTITKVKSRHNPDVLILLNHSGEPEDVHIIEALQKWDADAVQVHISSHSHDVYLKHVGGAYIHQAGAYATNLGVLQFSYDFETKQLRLLNENTTDVDFFNIDSVKNEKQIVPLRIPINYAIPYDQEMLAKINLYKKIISQSFLSKLPFSYDSYIGVIHTDKSDEALVTRIADYIREEFNLELAQKAKILGHDNVDTSLDFMMLPPAGVRMHVADIPQNGTELQFSDVFRLLGIGVLNSNFTPDIVPGNRVAHFYLPHKYVRQLLIQIDIAGKFINNVMYTSYSSNLNYRYRYIGIPFYNLLDIELNGKPLGNYDRLIHVGMPEFVALFLKLTNKFSFGLLNFKYYDRFGREIDTPFFSDQKDYVYVAQRLAKLN
jgi:2',3'-cyclic-nucleotide 2'-phosphodiesterase (5'-nucleotidase family)